MASLLASSFVAAVSTPSLGLQYVKSNTSNDINRMDSRNNKYNTAARLLRKTGCQHSLSAANKDTALTPG
jgi:hypothetical protein